MGTVDGLDNEAYREPPAIRRVKRIWLPSFVKRCD